MLIYAFIHSFILPFIHSFIHLTEDQEETESEEDDYDNGDVDEIFELDDEPIKKRSDDEDEEEEAADPFSTGLLFLPIFSVTISIE